MSHFSPHLHALKALGVATVYTGVTAVIAVKTTMWMMDIDNVYEFNDRMRGAIGGKKYDTAKHDEYVSLDELWKQEEKG